MNGEKKPGCLGSILQAFGIISQPTVQEEGLPYHLRDDFLSPAELNFYRVLCTAAGDWAVICPKVSLGDLFYAQTGDYATNTAYRNKIDRKHVDFLLCDSHSMVPLVGIELDDASHQRAYRRDRDRFVDQVFEAADLPLLRREVQASYNVRALSATLRDCVGVDEEEPDPQAEPEATSPVTVPDPAVPQVDAAEKADAVPPPLSTTDKPPACPKCGQPMVLRVVKKEGPHQGKKFWGCRDFPRCCGLREYASQGHPASPPALAGTPDS